MKDINKEIDLIFESSWSRVLQWINSYDIATITAFRSKLKDVTEHTFIPENKQVGDSFTLQENRVRNKELKAKLLSCGYGVTNIHGNYIEGISGADAVEVGEESFFVVNLKNDSNFYNELFQLSEYYNQDSFLYKPKEDEQAYLVGTNNSDYPGYQQKDIAGTLTSLPSKFMSRIKNAAFAFVKKDQWVKHDEKSDLTADEMNDYEHSYSWHKDEKPTFANRKALRAQMLKESEDWEMMKKNNGIVLETIKDYTPFSRQSIGSYASRIKLNENVVNKFNELKMNERSVACDQFNVINEKLMAFEKGLKRLDESSIERILSHGKKGFIVISANRSEIYSSNKKCDLTKQFEQWCTENGKDCTNEKIQSQWLKDRNKKADLDLKADLKESPFSYSAVFGGYHGADNVTDSFEPSYIVYTQGRPDKTLTKNITFNVLYKYALMLCAKYDQESVYVQAPGQAPNWIDRHGKQTNSHSSLNFKINRDNETYYTTNKRDKDHPQRFTADIVFENMYCSRGASSYPDRIKRTQAGEIFL